MDDEQAERDNAAEWDSNNHEREFDAMAQDLARSRANERVLEGENRSLQVNIDRTRRQRDILRAERDAQVSEVRNLQEALGRYGGHILRCKHYSGLACTCGYEAALYCGKDGVSL